jgi:hypothetical protein
VICSRPRILGTWLAATAAVLAACGSADETRAGDPTVATPRSEPGEPASAASAADESSPSTGAGEASAVVPFAVEQVPASPIEDVPSGLTVGRSGTTETGLPEPAVPLDELRPGGPPPDGIPPIDEPRFVSAAAADFLADNEPVLAFELDGEARAYPVQILIWHEIVNDTVAGVPVAITYCPLCNSAVAYDRRVGDRVLTFGTSGLLYNSALVMWDRQTETLWSHFTGRAVVGVLTGTELETYAMATIGWRAWRDAHPDGLVLSRETGHDRDYGQNPYPGYDDITARPFLFEGVVDGRFTAMTRVVGIEGGGDAVAIPLVELQDAGVVRVEVGGAPVTVWWTAGTASALDSPTIADGVDIGATGAFSPVVDGEELTFRATESGFVDEQTGSSWDLFGTAVGGPLAGTELEAVVHVDTFWFAWSTFQPATSTVGSADPASGMARPTDRVPSP